MYAISSIGTITTMAYLCTFVACAETCAGEFGYETSYWIPLLVCNYVDSGLLISLTIITIQNLSFTRNSSFIIAGVLIILSILQLFASLYHNHKWNIIHAFYNVNSTNKSDWKRIDKALNNCPPLDKFEDNDRYNRMMYYHQKRFSEWL